MLTDDEKRELIAIPRPVVPFGPEGVPEDQATANYLRAVVKKIDGKYANVGGSNVTATVRKLLLDAADALEGTLTEPEWRGVVLGRGNATDVDANWQLTVWDPAEIETARREFPKSEYKLARMILDESEVPDV